MWECLQKDSHITSSDSYTENCLLSDTGFHLLLTFWSFHGFFMPEAWFWEWKGADISVTGLSYWKEIVLCPNQNIFLEKLIYSENNNSMVHSKFRKTRQHIKLSNGGLVSKMHWIIIHCVAFLQLCSLRYRTRRKLRECMCLLTISSRTEESFTKQQFAQRLSGNREGGHCPP